MSTSEQGPEEAITEEEIEGTAPAPCNNATPGAVPKRNAFAELMKPKPKPAAAAQLVGDGRFKGRDGLGAYIADPAAWPASRVIYHDADFVAINDLYPKSSVHTLLIPRSPLRRLHPFEAFDNPGFLAAVQDATLKLKRLVAKELQRRYGSFSEKDRLRQAVLNGDVEWEGTELPQGRDWEREVLVGIHAHPSMNDLHVHVLSRDMYSECLKHRKHYNSMNTPFLVDVADFPLAPNDPRRHERYLDREYVCWRCGRNFGNKFTELKKHLALEFEGWKKE